MLLSQSQAYDLGAYLPRPYRCSSPPAFIQRYFFDGPLNFDQIECLTLQYDGVAQNGLDFAQFVFVAGDKIELGGRHYYNYIIIIIVVATNLLEYLLLHTREAIDLIDAYLPTLSSICTSLAGTRQVLWYVDG